MGYSLSWLAVKGKTAQIILGELGLAPTGEREELPEADLAAVEMPNGWYVIVANIRERIAGEAVLRRLSSGGGEAVSCFVEEHVMVSSAEGWTDGNLGWSVIHDSQKHRLGLETKGDLPPAYQSILSRLKIQQAQADAEKRNVDFIFDVPVELARSMVGYRHDQDIPGLEGDVFEVLDFIGGASAASPKKTSFFRKFFS